MVLLPAALASSLVRDWLPPTDGPWHPDAQASATALAGAVAGWFGQAQAAGLPCATAGVRRDQLAATLVPALQVQDGSAAGQQIALAFASYVTGQAFGPGAAAPPLATSAGGGMIGAALVATHLSQHARAQQLAAGHHAVAVSALVAFPGPPPSTAPIT